MVHVDDGQVRTPLGQDRFGFGHAARGANDEETVIQG